MSEIEKLRQQIWMIAGWFMLAFLPDKPWWGFSALAMSAVHFWLYRAVRRGEAKGGV